MRNLFLIAVLFIVLYSDDNSKQDFKSLIEIYLDQSNSCVVDRRLRIDFTNKAFRLNDLTKLDSLKLANYVKISNRYWNDKEYDKYKKTTDLVLLLSKKLKNDFFEAKGDAYLGDYYAQFQIRDSAQYYYLLSINLLGEDRLDEKAKINYKIARNLFVMGDYLWSEDYALESLGYFRKNVNNQIKFGLFTLLGAINEELDYKNVAVNYFKCANEISEANHCIENVDISNNNLGHIYYKKGNFKKAVKYYKKIKLEAKLRQNDPELYGILCENLALVYHRLNIKKDSLEVLFSESIKIKDSLDLDRINSRIVMSQFFEQIRKIDESVKLSREALQISKTSGTSNEKMAALRRAAILGIIDKNEVEELFSLYDKAYIKEKKVKNKFARIHYETAELALEKDKAISQKNIILIIFCVTVIIGWIAISIKSKRNRYKKYQLVLENQKIKNEISDLMFVHQQKLESVREEENARVSRDLHDSVLNTLSSIRINLFALRISKTEETVTKCLPYIDKIQEVEKEVRNISQNLQQNVSNDNDFVLVLREMFDDLNLDSNIYYSLTVDNSINWFEISLGVRINVYRIVQESLYNIKKHSKATNAIVEFSKTGERISLRIADNGEGFDLSEVRKGLGLKNIKFRVNEIDGKFSIYKAEPQGTILSILF